jgi:hypothetical protein
LHRRRQHESSYPLAYQTLIGLSDTLTGALLIVAPEFTLRLMGLHAPSDALAYLSFIGAFVLSVGLACLYGAPHLFAEGAHARFKCLAAHRVYAGQRGHLCGRADH